MTLADRIVLMDDGNIVQVGTPLELFETPVNTFVATFIGSPPMNMIDGVIKGDKVQLSGGPSLPIPPKSRGLVENNQAIKFGFRADDVTPVGHGAKMGLPIRPTFLAWVSIGIGPRSPKWR